MTGCCNEVFQMAGDWLKVIILYHFRRMTSFVYDYQRHLQEIHEVSLYVHEIS